MRVLVFGDSITYGSWDSQGGWADRLKSWAHDVTLQSNGAQKMQVLNLGIGGDSSTKILARLRSEIEARQSESWSFVFVFAFGTNDERSIDGMVETSLEQFTANVREIIAVSKEFTDKIFFVEIPPLGKDVVSFKAQEYSMDRIVAYSQALETVVNELDVQFLPVRTAFESSNSQLFSYDALHPNDEGHRLICEAVKAKIQELQK